MIPSVSVAGETAQRIPRESGDDPVSAGFSAVRALYSPRERG